MNQPDSWFVPDTCTEIAGEPTFAENYTPTDSTCPDCGGELRLVGEDVSEILEMITAKLQVICSATNWMRIARQSG